MIAETFLPNPNNKKTINHIDGDKTNNHISNLEWSSYSENCKHAYDILNRIKYIWAHHKRSKSILQYDLNMKFIKEFNSIMDAQRELSIDNASIVNVCKGKYKQTHWFIFKYK